MINNRKWAVIFIPSLIISAIQATPNLLPLVHNEHHHHHPEVLPTPITLDHEPHLAHPVPLSHGEDLHHNHEKLPLPLAHDPHKHDHHHYKDPYVSKHSKSKSPTKSLINEISKISIIEKALPVKSGRFIKMDDPYLIAHMHGPPYLSKDPIPLVKGIHNRIYPEFHNTRNVLDPPRTIKSMPLILNNPHAFKNFIGKQKSQSPLSHQNIINHIPHDYKTKFLKDHEIKYFPFKTLPLDETDSHDPNLVETFSPLVNGHHGIHHDPHHHHYEPYHPIPQYYHFGYQVNSLDGYGANDYHGHTEQADAYTKKGEYKVKLPDGRLQVISYIADEYGFKPRITYEYPEGHPPPHDHHADLKHPPHPAPHPPHPLHPAHAGHDIVPHHPAHPAPHPHVVPHEHIPVKKPYHPPTPPKSIYKHPVEKEYLPPKPVLKLEKIPHPTPTPINYVTPDPTIILPLASYEEPHSPKKLIHHEIGHNNIDLSYLPPTGHSDIDLSYLPPTMHSTPSNLVYKALPLRTVHDSSSIGMVHKGSPYVQPKIKTYIPPEKAHDVSPDVYVTPKPAYVTPKPASYVTPLPKQVSQLRHKVPTVTPTPVVMYSTTPKMVNSLYTVPYHNSIERHDTSSTSQIDASLKQHYYLVSYQDPEDHKPKLFLLAKKN